MAGKSSGRNPGKKAVVALVVAAAVIAAGLAVRDALGSAGKVRGAQVVRSGGFLEIDEGKIGGRASFFPVEVDGVRMEVLAVRASDGTVRAAFNTCQSCFASGAGYYALEGAELVCQNCGFRFRPDQVEVRSGGCNPWPIFSENKRVEGGTIRIPYDFLRKSSVIFANWQRG